MSKVKNSKRTNQFNIKCLECNTIMDSDHRSKHNKFFHLNLSKNEKSIKWAVLNAPKNPFITSSRSQSVLTSSLDKTDGIQEPQTDSYVTTHSTINVELISHEATTNTKDEIFLRLK